MVPSPLRTQVPRMSAGTPAPLFRRRVATGTGTGVLALASAALFCGAVPARAQEAIELRAVEGMRFEPVRRAIEPGGRRTILFQNADATDQPHNVIIVRPGHLKSAIDAALALGADGPARDFVPRADWVLAKSRLLPAGERQEITFEVPAEPGIYPYVCTFPGHSYLMFGAFYAGVPMPAERTDPNIPRPVDVASQIEPDPRPMVRRMFMPHSGPASIAIALPGGQNACWDAGACQLRYLWDGGFVDAEKYFLSKGQSEARLLGGIWWHRSGIHPLRIGDRSPKRVEFHGYSLRDGLPEFEYSLDGVPVKERITAVDGRWVRWDFTVGSVGPIEVALGAVDHLTVTPSIGSIDPPGRWRVPAEAGGTFNVVLGPTGDLPQSEAKAEKESPPPTR